MRVDAAGIYTLGFDSLLSWLDSLSAEGMQNFAGRSERVRRVSSERVRRVSSERVRRVSSDRVRRVSSDRVTRMSSDREG